MSSELPGPEVLARHHDLDEFVSGSVEQSDWLRRYALQAMTSGATKVFVVTSTDSNAMVAYYAWTMEQIDVADAPRCLVKGAGHYPQPVAQLARLGVHQKHKKKSLGDGSLQGVFRRVAAISNEIGCRGLLAHAEPDRARCFYRYLIPEFEQSPTDELHLVLLLKDIKRTLQRTADEPCGRAR